MQSKIIKYLYIVLTLFIVSTTVQPMAISVPRTEPRTDIQIPVVSFLKLKPYPFMEYIGQYKCDKYAIQLKNWFKGRGSFDTKAMFTHSRVCDVSNFLHALAREVGGVEVIEFDFRQDIGDSVREKDAFKRAQDAYDRTGKPAIIHAYHSRIVSKKEEKKEEFPPGLKRDLRVLELLKECGEYIINPPFILVYTTEGSKMEFSLDVRSRISESLQLYNEYVYWGAMGGLPKQMEEVQLYNEAVYYVNGLLTGGLVTGTAAGLYLAIKFLKYKK